MSERLSEEEREARHRIDQVLAFLDARDSIGGVCLTDEIRSLLAPSAADDAGRP